MDSPPEKSLEKAVSAAFAIGDERHVESDPRCGLLMLAEIADRALSPAVNDPGTAIAVIGAQFRLLSCWADSARKREVCRFPLLEARVLEAEDLLEDAFSSIARDGAGVFEVGSRLQKTFLALQRLENEAISSAASLQSDLALEQALLKLPTGYHREKITELASLVKHHPRS